MPRRWRVTLLVLVLCRAGHRLGVLDACFPAPKLAAAAVQAVEPKGTIEAGGASDAAVPPSGPGDKPTTL